jgi:DNA-binding beta-propeller fold protein YncE
MQRSALFLLLVVSLTSSFSYAAGPAGYGPVKHLVLGGDGGWDYLTFDSANHRFFIARATRVMVVDPDSGNSLGEIPDTPGVHGVALAPDLGRGFTSNGRESMVTIFDLKTLKPIQKVKTGDTPDAIAYDTKTQRVFTFNAHGHSASAIDAAKGTPIGEIPLGGKPEFAVSDGKGHVYVNIEDKSELAVIDPEKLTVTARRPLAPCEEPSGLALDAEHHRLFAGCSNKLMAVVNADTGHVVTTLPIGEGVDANAFDPGTQLAFASNGDGTLTVVHEDAPDKYSVLGNVETARGARTMALNPGTHTIYLVTAKFGPRPAATPDNPRPRPPILPGSFELLIVPKQ